MYLSLEGVRGWEDFGYQVPPKAPQYSYDPSSLAVNFCIPIYSVSDDWYPSVPPENHVISPPPLPPDDE